MSLHPHIWESICQLLQEIFRNWMGTTRTRGSFHLRILQPFEL